MNGEGDIILIVQKSSDVDDLLDRKEVSSRDYWVGERVLDIGRVSENIKMLVSYWVLALA